LPYPCVRHIHGELQNLRLSDAAALLGLYGKEIILQGLQYLSANWDSENHRACLLHWLARVHDRTAHGALASLRRLERVTASHPLRKFGIV
jgi:hypothetical protein